MHLHEFLRRVHEVLKPEVYLEVGVQYGTSLALAEKSRLAIGVDPQPLMWATDNQRPNQEVYAMASDTWFEFTKMPIHPPVNLGFIDGLHLFEQALRDFMNMERMMTPGGVIIVDDVLPYNQAIAEREQPPGDWTGDVWKVYPILHQVRPDLKITLVDTQPTGTMVITNLDSDYDWQSHIERATAAQLVSLFMNPNLNTVPPFMLNRMGAVSPEQALEDLCVLQSPEGLASSEPQPSEKWNPGAGPPGGLTGPTATTS